MSSYSAQTNPIPPLSLDLAKDIESLVLEVVGSQEINAGTDLIEEGILDSLALVSLIMELETKFSLEISYDDLEIDSFRTLQSIGHFVRSSEKG